ncbi:MAG: ferritin-like domain-containing protein [Candidatus ainarchaeum sp.]|nr:ferritin-like domain-containing protein [Candidatus ainarchaeum sp.]
MDEIVRLITPKETNEILDELNKLYLLESYAQFNYNQQAMRFDGKIVIILNDLEKKEAKHKFYLSTLLLNANQKIGDLTEEEMRNVPRKNLDDSIKMDLLSEDQAIDLYEIAIKKSKSENMKKFLNGIKNEEIQHFQTLKNYIDQIEN